MISESLKVLKWDTIATSIIAILLGLVFILSPQFSADIISYAIGIAFGLTGLFNILYSLFGNAQMGGRSVIAGVVFLVLGIYICLNPALVQTLLALMIGLFILLDAGTSLSFGITLLRSGVKGAAPIVVVAFIILLLGIAILFGNFDFVMILSGITLVADGIFGILLIVCFRKLAV